MQFVALEFLCVQFQNFLLTFFWQLCILFHLDNPVTTSFQGPYPLLQNTYHPPSNQVKVKAIHSF